MFTKLRSQPRMPKQTNGVWVVEMPGYNPPSVNRLIGQHWGKLVRHKRLAYDALAIAVYRAGVPRARGKRRLSVTVTQAGRGRLMDASNVLKVLEDGLVRCGALRDDGPAFLELGKIEVRRGEQRGTCIELEDRP